FPVVDMKGDFQRKPQLLHMAGQVQNGDAQVSIEYYQDGGDLYIKQPLERGWYRLKDSTLDETAAFYPDNLAAPLLSGLRKAEFVGRERLTGGDTVKLQLDLDPNVMLPYATALRADKVEYMLWVYTRDLKPARMAIKVTPSPDNPDRQTSFFSYVVDLDLKRIPVWAMPPEIKQSAVLLDEGSAAPQPPPAVETP
ncbi:MAG: LppX_LprAFG lipoprotein, partial [Mycobacterium leprae]